MKKLLIIVLLVAIFTGFGSFRTGCNVFGAEFEESYSFTIMHRVEAAVNSPADGATGVDASRPIDIDLTQQDSLPITITEFKVENSGVPVDGVISVSNIPNGKKIVFTPSVNYPDFATINWNWKAECIGN